jgi:hypothetical protein
VFVDFSCATAVDWVLPAVFGFDRAFSAVRFAKWFLNV